MVLMVVLPVEVVLLHRGPPDPAVLLVALLMGDPADAALRWHPKEAAQAQLVTTRSATWMAVHAGLGGHVNLAALTDTVLMRSPMDAA